MKRDGDNLFIRYEKECDRRHKAEDNIACYRARLHLCKESMRSSLSTQPRAQSPSHSTLSMAWPSTTTITPMVGTPLCKRCATDSGAIDPAVDPYKPDN